ncbi:hypothetical protein H6G64_09565 [Calothrix sp. FACHB-156]|nr:hypothetical protein [Nostoc linckia FACHB-104]MBD2337237.1 hypothetical protein [Calothrix sp. FACHB-156]
MLKPTLSVEAIALLLTKSNNLFGKIKSDRSLNLLSPSSPTPHTGN